VLRRVDRRLLDGTRVIVVCVWGWRHGEGVRGKVALGRKSGVEGRRWGV